MGVARRTVPSPCDAGDLFIGEADDAQPRARGFERHFSRAHVVLGVDQLPLRLLIFLESRGLAFVQVLEPLLDDAREIEAGERALFIAVNAAMKSFCGCTTSGLSISNNASPRLTLSPTLGIGLVAPAREMAYRTAVLVSSL